MDVRSTLVASAASYSCRWAFDCEEARLFIASTKASTVSQYLLTVSGNIGVRPSATLSRTVISWVKTCASLGLMTSRATSSQNSFSRSTIELGGLRMATAIKARAAPSAAPQYACTTSVGSFRSIARSNASAQRGRACDPAGVAGGSEGGASGFVVASGLPSVGQDRVISNAPEILRSFSCASKSSIEIPAAASLLARPSIARISERKRYAQYAMATGHPSAATKSVVFLNMLAMNVATSILGTRFINITNRNSAQVMKEGRKISRRLQILQQRNDGALQ